jgi:DNA-directed RNA polymerase specialized sigma24 family protein
MPEMDTNDWNELWTRAKQGDPKSQEELFARLHVRLLRIAQSRIRGCSREELEDMVQDTLKIVWEKRDHIDSNPHKYALEVLRKKFGDAFRTSRRRREEALDKRMTKIADPQQNFTEQIADEDLTDHLMKAIPKLNQWCQAYISAWLKDPDRGELWEKSRKQEPGLTREAFDTRVWRCWDRLRQLAKRHTDQ